MRTMTRAGAGAFLLVAAALACGAAPPGKERGVVAEVRFTVKELDPKNPKGEMECVVRNGTGRPIEVPLGYADGFDSPVVLFGRAGAEKIKVEGLAFFHELRLVRWKDGKEAKKATAVVKPGEEVVVFRVGLDEMLLKPGRDRMEKKAVPRGALRWTWQA